MTTFRAESRIDPPLAADEATTLVAFLDYQRDTLRWKCSGLTADELARSVTPTSMTLGGLLKHLAVVEAGWLNQTFAGGVQKPSWIHEIDQNTPDWSFTTAIGASPEQLFGWLDESIQVSDRVIGEALAGPDARHNGHADLLREAIDGTTGE